MKKTNKFKSIGSMVVASAIVLSLVGCGEPASEADSTSSSSETTSSSSEVTSETETSSSSNSDSSSKSESKEKSTPVNDVIISKVSVETYGVDYGKPDTLETWNYYDWVYKTYGINLKQYQQ